MTTSPEVQDAVSSLSGIVSSPGMSQLAKAGTIHDDCEGGQPVVVAQRNAADKLLRAAYQDEHKRLVDLRGGKDVDHQAANEVLRVADRQLRGVLTTALNDVARETLGREGQLKASPSASPTATGTASPTPTPTPTATATSTASPTATPTCTPQPSATATPTATATVTATATATPAGSPSPEARGRVAVAARVTLSATLQAMVDKAKTDMKTIVDKAETDLAALPPAERGKPAEKGKPESQPGRADDKQNAEHGKPSERPGGRPSGVPGKP
ncbi:MAG: hypothetical protein HY553_11220 [Elusimicrobia bacterium]|nr:hypothetical protein [Elusimicrobiota bacterium]